MGLIKVLIDYMETKRQQDKENANTIINYHVWAPIILQGLHNSPLKLVDNASVELLITPETLRISTKGSFVYDIPCVSRNIGSEHCRDTIYCVNKVLCRFLNLSKEQYQELIEVRILGTQLIVGRPLGN